jgi:hypothetical protein
MPESIEEGGSMRDTPLWARLLDWFGHRPPTIEQVEGPAPASGEPAHDAPLRYAVTCLQHWLDLNA